MRTSLNSLFIQQIRFLENSLWGSAGIVSLQIDFVPQDILSVTVIYKGDYPVSRKIQEKIVELWNPGWGAIFHDEYLNRSGKPEN